MIVLDLFCGTKSIANAFEARGHKVFTVDWDKQFNPDLAADIGTLTAADIINLCGGVPTVIWASPDCTTYSVAAISKHRRREPNGNLIPISDYAKRCDEINKHLIDLINELKPQYWFIENPRAAMRKMDFMQGLPRYTVTYCQYGERRQKPTDIWTNHPKPEFKPPCKSGAPCHDAAPRGASTGTQSLKNRIEKAKIPLLLCQHIVDICERGENKCT
jgi:site-specific DNA-cytosine methylase